MTIDLTAHRGAMLACFVAVGLAACGGETGTDDNPSTPHGGGIASGGAFSGASGAGTGVSGAFVGTSGSFPTGTGGTFPGTGGTLPVGTGGSLPTGTGGTLPTGTGGSDPNAGGSDPIGTGGTSVGGGGGGTCCPDGNCVCRGPDPTEQSATANGMFNVQNYNNGFRDGPAFLGATIYYPTDAEPPLSAVVICPGWTALQDSMAGWGPFFGSHGIIVMTIDTNTILDWVDVRDDALMDALESLKAENTRAGSPLEGKLSQDRFGLMGWSMGGGGTWMATKANPQIKTGISLAGHHATAGGAPIASGITVPSLLFAGALDTPILGGGQQSQQVYDVIPNTTPKILYEIAAADHFAWGTPLQTGGGTLGRYALSFQKVFLEGDERYRQFLLVEGPGASDWRSNL